MDEPTYDIQELVDLSGVARRNIYFYIQQGVLPAPQGAGLAARYQEEHLLRLRLIPHLRREGLPLGPTRERFAGTEMPALRRLYPPHEPPPVPPAPAPGAHRRLHMEALVVPPRLPGPTLDQAAACRRFDLPGGMLLIVPEKISAEDLVRLEKILEAAGIQ